MSQRIRESTQVLEETAVLAALEQSLAMIEFNMQGEVLWANEQFARTMGYSSSELVGKHHRMFCSSDFADSQEYGAFWDHLRNGKPFQQKIARVAKSGEIVWLEATYMPVLIEHGQSIAVLKVATDITTREEAASRMTDQLQFMAADLLGRTEAGVRRNHEIASAIQQVAEDSERNLRFLGELEEQTKAVNGIVQMIHDFSSQTHLLGLNAAIEAAHADEHGRGFQVVATEVRKLAQHVQEAAAEIQAVVEGIFDKVDGISGGMRSSQNAIAECRHQIQQATAEFANIGEAAGRLDEQAKTLS